jgi:hypothetical protein
VFFVFLHVHFFLLFFSLQGFLLCWWNSPRWQLHTRPRLRSTFAPA